MQERSHSYADADSDEESDITLATPRFDADEARHAHPVVPLEEVRAGRRAWIGLGRFRAGARRRWPLSLIVVGLLAVAAIGAVATKVMRRNQVASTTTAPAPAEAAQTATQTPPQANSNPSQPDATTQAQPAPATNDAGTEAGDGHSTRHAQEATTTRAREEPATRAERPASTLPPEDARAPRAAVEGGGEKRHGHDGASEDGNGRDEAKDEKDSGKARKHGKKEARLVDVLVGPSRPRP